MADTSSPDVSQQLQDLLLQRLMNPQGSGNPLTDLSQITGNAAAGQLNAQRTQAELDLAKGGLSKSLFDAAMNRAKAAATLPTYRASQAETGDLLANTQDVGVNPGSPEMAAHMTTFTGGRRPSALGPNARAAGAALSNIGASSIGNDQLPHVPTAPDVNIGGFLNNLLNGASAATGIAGALAKAAGGSGGSSGGDLSKLAQLFQRGGTTPKMSTPGQPDMSGASPFLPNDSLMFPLGPDFTGPTDPSGGTGVGPGMQEYYDWLAQQGGGGGEDDQSLGSF